MPHSAMQVTDLIERAESEIFATFGDRVSFIEKAKTLFKFGSRSLASSGTEYTLMGIDSSVEHEAYVSSNAIDTVSSSSASDTGLIGIEGHTISGSDLTFVTQDATLDGQNKVTLATPLARSTRVYNKAATELIGIVSAYEDGAITAGVPDVENTVHIIISAGKQQSEKAATAFSQFDYFLMTQTYFAVSRGGATANVDWEIQCRQPGGVFLPLSTGSVRSSGKPSDAITYGTPVIVPKNSDVRLACSASANNTPVFGWFCGYIGIII